MDNIGGAASCSGFEIVTNIGKYSTSGYQPEVPKFRLEKISRFFWIAGLTVWLPMMAIFLPGPELFSRGIIGVLLFLAMAYCASRGSSYLLVLFYSIFHCLSHRQIRKWHACEHQLATLLTSDKAVSMENLKKASRIHAKDAAKVFFYRAIFYFMLWTCPAAMYAHSLPEYSFYLMSGMFFLCFLGQTFIMLAARNLFFLRLSYVSPAVILGALCQCFTTAPPDEEQLEEALALANLYLQDKKGLEETSLRLFDLARKAEERR